MLQIILILFLPLLGTTLGGASVVFVKNQLNKNFEKLMLGFASGVMVAASVWSLIMPAIESSENMGKFAFLPAAVGIALGMGFLFLLDKIVPHMHINTDEQDGPKAKLKKTTMLVFAVILHNIPEGMAVGVVLAGVLSGNTTISMAGATALAVGIAVQNFPEGAVISLPLKNAGVSKGKSFLYSLFSGIVEPIAAIITVLLGPLVVSILPYLLGFAAGAMLFVVVEELIPEASEGEHSNNGTVGFGIGFILMMILDIALG